jgi:hypothetical protein
MRFNTFSEQVEIFPFVRYIYAKGDSWYNNSLIFGWLWWGWSINFKKKP